MAEFGVMNEDYDTLDWIDKVQTKPTKEEVEEALSVLNENQLDPKIAGKRLSSYPPLADFADAYYWAQKGDNSKMEEYLKKIEEVKNKYPKVTNNAN
jgi:hypothetical protein